MLVEVEPSLQMFQWQCEHGMLRHGARASRQVHLGAVVLGASQDGVAISKVETELGVDLMSHPQKRPSYEMV
jgi:hypothetical protein